MTDLNIQWDHIIHYIKGLEGFEFPHHLIQLNEGGKHTALGTYNYLSYFGLSYIEWIDVFNQELVENAAAGDERLSFAATLSRTNYEEGLKRLCFRTDDIHTLKSHLENCGLTVIGPTKMSRTKPDGQVIEWQLLYIDEKRLDRELPFFIQWGKSDELRCRELKSLFQPLQITEIHIQTTNKKMFIEEWSAWLGAEYKEDYLQLEDSPKFYITEGPKEMITGVTIKGQLDQQLYVHGAIYQFYE